MRAERVFRLAPPIDQTKHHSVQRDICKGFHRPLGIGYEIKRESEEMK
jgi:hypothetical protein